MIKNLIAFSARHPLSILSALAGLALLGLASAFVIPLDFLPLMEERILIVSTEYPSVSAEEMRSMVTIPLEDAFASLGGLKSLSSVSREGLSLLRIELHWGTGTDLALAECREIIDIVYEGLPSLCSKPKVSRGSGSGDDTITIILVPLDADLRNARHVAETDIKPRLQRLNGAALVTVLGGEEEEIQVNFQKQGLESRNLSLSAAAQIIAAANFEYPGGTITEGDSEYTVKTSGLYRSLEEIRQTPLAWDQGGLLRVGDIAEVSRGTGRQDTFFLYRSAEAGIPRITDCIRIGIQKRQDAAPLPLSLSVRKEIVTLQSLYSGYRFEIAGDMSEQIVESLRSLLFSALAAILAAALVVFFFLKSVKLSLVITGIIPLSALFSVLSLGITGRSLNLMSLSGLAIGIGMVIDAGTVAIEQIDAEMRRSLKTGVCDGGNGNYWPEPVIRGVSAVALSSGASALSTVIVFIPVFFIPGLLGELFGDMALAVISSISFSCILSFTYIPALVSLLKPALRAEAAGEAGGAAARLNTALEKRYRGILRFLFRKPRYSLIPLGACLALGALSLGLSEFTLLPELSSPSLSWELSFAPGTSLEKMRRTALELGRGLEAIGEIKALEISGGLDSEDLSRLADPGEIAEKIVFTGRLRGKAEEARISIMEHFRGTPYEPVFLRGRDLLSTVLEGGGTEILVRSDDPEEARAKAEAVLRALEDRGGQEVAQDYLPRVIQTSPALIPDRLALARFSLSAQFLARTTRDVLEGIRETYYEGGKEIPLVIRLRKEDLRSPENIGDTMISLESGSIPLRLLGSMGEEERETVLYRYNRRDAKIFNFPLPGELQEEFALVSPRGEETGEMIRLSFLLLIITLCLLYLSMGAQFESFLIPLILLLAIPPSFAGAFFLLLVSSVKPDINSMIALVILFGISINNSILLYESCLGPGRNDITQSNVQGIARGRHVAGIIENCVKKLRAIMITNITTIAALIPFAFDPLGVNSQVSLSIALIGGLLFSLALVLPVFPLCIGRFPAGSGKSAVDGTGGSP
ncbi:MAG: efflux RND transporter permease subunit [Treponema sp.]|jgi:multidrug efflux pump subunit AcrB|nr:efflux RND transporter permease subunit [Treponema sp.]